MDDAFALAISIGGDGGEREPEEVAPKSMEVATENCSSRGVTNRIVEIHLAAAGWCCICSQAMYCMQLRGHRLGKQTGQPTNSPNFANGIPSPAQDDQRARISL